MQSSLAVDGKCGSFGSFGERWWRAQPKIVVWWNTTRGCFWSFRLRRTVCVCRILDVGQWQPTENTVKHTYKASQREASIWRHIGTVFAFSRLLRRWVRAVDFSPVLKTPTSVASAGDWEGGISTGNNICFEYPLWYWKTKWGLQVPSLRSATLRKQEMPSLNKTRAQLLWEWIHLPCNRIFFAMKYFLVRVAIPTASCRCWDNAWLQKAKNISNQQ